MLASHRSEHAEADSNNGCLISTLKVITWKITCFLLPPAELLAIAGHITFNNACIGRQNFSGTIILKASGRLVLEDHSYLGHTDVILRLLVKQA